MKNFLLSMMLCVPAMLAAQSNGVTVSGLAVNAGTVTFNVSWDKDNPNMPELWSDSVWVFVDYNNAGKMERLPVTAATASAGTVTMAPNNKGVWVMGNARTNGSFSATVQLLTATADIAGACAYASNYPPVGEYVSDIEISFTGTPVYDVVLKHSSGSTITVQSGGTFLLPCDYALMSFTDATETPGIMKCIPMTGSIDFSVPPNIVKGVTASFVLNNQPTAPNPTSVTYRWAAPDFSPATYAGRTYTATVPGIAGTYPITLTAQSERYCDIAITKDVEVLDCDAPGSTVNFTAFSPCSNASTGDYWYLADTREEAYNNTQMYKVKKMADGRIWMVQDLKFGDKCTKTTFTGSTSDQQGNVSNTFPEHYGDCRYNPTSGAGYFYDWAAVLNKAGAYSGGPDVGCNGTGISAFSCQGLCPSDWHIPTYDEAIAYNLLYGTSCASSPCWWNNNDIMEIVPSGNWLGTGVDYPQFVYISLSTQANSTSMWMFDSGSCNANGICPNRRKNGGIVARCLMNY